MSRHDENGSDAERYLGVDIGGTKTAVVLGDREGRVIDRRQLATDHQAGPQVMLDRIIALGKELRDLHGPVVAAGVSCGGPLDPVQGVVQSPPNLPGWDDIPVTRLLQEAWQVPVRLMNDANAGALAEWWFGSGRGAVHFVFITFGTGLGAGLILNGELYEGAGYLAGEIGHIRVAESGPTAYGKTGSLEAFCSGPGLRRLAMLYAPRFGVQLAQWSTEEITRKALEGDPACRYVVRACGRWFGKGLAVLVDLLNPERIAVGGMAVRLGDLLLEPARQVLASEALARAAASCEVMPAALGERLGDVASLCVAYLAR